MQGTRRKRALIAGLIAVVAVAAMALAPAAMAADGVGLGGRTTDKSVTFFCFGFIMANFNALAMEPMGRIAGTASSFVGAVTTAVAVVLGLLVGQSFNGTVMPLLLGYACFGLIALAVVLTVERGRLFGTGAA